MPRRPSVLSTRPGAAVVAALTVVFGTGAIRGCAEEAQATEMTGQCGGTEPRKSPEDPESGVVTIDLAGDPRPGGELDFAWPDPQPGTFMLDDFIVQCWTTRGWRSAWVQLNAFGIDGEPSVMRQKWRTNPPVDLSTQTHTESAGSLMIPSTAPKALYRFQMIRSAGNVDWTTGEVRFELD